MSENLSAPQSPENYVSPTTIYRIPSSLRNLDPNAYEPRVVSIGPYHHGKAQLKEMEKLKHSAVKHIWINRNRGTIEDSERIHDEYLHFFGKDFLGSAEGIVAGFFNQLRGSYSDRLDLKEKRFLRVVFVDACFLLDLLLHDRPENRALLSYMKMDLLVLDNQIPLLVLRTLASIIGVGYLNFTWLIWKFYGTMNDEIPENLPDDAHHVLDAYRKSCIGTGAYDGWESRRSARELYFYGVEFRASSGLPGLADGFVGKGSFTDVAFEVSDLFNICKSQNGQAQQNHQNGQDQNNQNGQDQNNQLGQDQNNQNGQDQRTLNSRMIRTLLPLITAAKGIFSLPRLTIDGTTKPTLQNLMDFERLHLRFVETRPVTNYVSLMGSLIRSEKDVEHLRDGSILLCSPGWTDESVVKLFADLTRNVIFNGTKTRKSEIDALCKRPLNRFWSFWRRVASKESSDAKALCLLLLSLYGLLITAASTYFSIAKYVDDKKH